jgi:hypothetical protein
MLASVFTRASLRSGKRYRWETGIMVTIRQYSLSSSLLIELHVLVMVEVNFDVGV